MSENVLVRTWVRKYIPMILLTGTGLLFLIDYSIKIDPVSAATKQLSLFVIILANLALLVALTNYLHFNYRQFTGRLSGWKWRVYGTIVLLIYIAYGLYVGAGSKEYFSMMYHTMAACATSSNGMTIFFITSAAYRSFRVRNLMAGVLLIVAFVMMLGNAPIGATFLPIMVPIKDWLTTNPVAAGQRALTMAIQFGAVYLVFRVLLGREKGGVPRE